ncbi:cytochrome c4 [Thiohalocapsa marina]|uniref:Cytochrome c4 n=2 Tax=Thiohalocapsa marina TaxID=424902 RepID=A0A5M8FRR5_9GAMM|nr:c-type cytochrome [Thiohalocapsa marina]KAA6185685.1 cytochrome c4 [Thiohalocapsa marina]
MAKLTTKLALIGGTLALGLSSGAMAEGATAKMLADTCAGCHGTNGNSVGPASPTIAGMDPLVFVDTMLAFQSGDTYSTIMGRIARGYSEEELEKMGEFFHAQEFIPAAQEFNHPLVDQGAKLHDKYCEKCHIEGGKPVPDEEDYYILAGQWTPYLKYAMSDFQEGRRILPKKMGKKLEAMIEDHGAESVDALYAFYAAYSDFESAGGDDDDED